eukprot:m.41145 g.41145  ORF g.41145 m.41145 type:complete len:54 (-) comp16826_c0_seq2:31-192(-)
MQLKSEIGFTTCSEFLLVSQRQNNGFKCDELFSNLEKLLFKMHRNSENHIQEQ